MIAHPGEPRHCTSADATRARPSVIEQCRSRLPASFGWSDIVTLKTPLLQWHQTFASHRPEEVAASVLPKISSNQPDLPSIRGARMKFLFRRFVDQYSELSRTSRISQWAPKLLRDVHIETASSSTPNPLRTACCLYVVEHLLDAFNLGHSIRTEIMAGVYQCGQAVDELLRNGVSASIIDCLFNSEAAEFANAQLQQARQNLNDAHQHYGLETRRKVMETRLQRTALKRAFFSQWRQQVQRPWLHRIVHFKKKDARSKTLASIFQNWRLCASKSQLECEHRRSLLALEQTFQEQLEMIRLSLSESEARCSKFQTQLSESEKRLHTWQPQMHRSDYRENKKLDAHEVACREDVEGTVTHCLGKLCNDKMAALRAKVGRFRLGVTAEHLMELSKCNNKTTGSSDDKLPAVQFLLAWCNHILRSVSHTGQVAQSIAKDFADGVLYMKLVDYLWEEASLVALAEAASAEVRMEGVISQLKTLFRKSGKLISLSWLTVAAVNTRPEVNSAVLFLLFERYTATHSPLPHLTDISLLASNDPIAALREIDELETAWGCKRAAFEELNHKVRDELWDAFFAMPAPHVYTQEGCSVEGSDCIGQGFGSGV
ncbi:hypothetical protein DIPPA_52575 [Diplonema papillatum]|nr:hypothetical protein DIPPA_52575 [Diplonema papillatum]